MSRKYLNEKALNIFKVIITFLLGHLLFDGFITKLAKSIIGMTVDNLAPLSNSTSKGTLDLACQQQYNPEDKHAVELVIEITLGAILTVLPLACLHSVWKMKSRVITINSILLSLYCLLSNIYIAIRSTIRYERLNRQGKYYLILDVVTIVLFEILCSLCLFLLSREVKLLNKTFT